MLDTQNLHLPVPVDVNECSCPLLFSFVLVDNFGNPVNLDLSYACSFSFDFQPFKVIIPSFLVTLRITFEKF